MLAAAAALVVLALVAAVAPPGARAASESRVARIGYLASESTPDSTPVLRRALRDLGWVEGRNLTIRERYAQGRFDLFPGQVDEVVRLGVDVLVLASPAAVEAARRATKTIPLVMVTTDDPVANGLVATPGRPEGNLTGLSLYAPDLAERRLGLLRQVVPGAARVAVVWNPSNPTCALELRAARVAARALGVELIPIELKAEGDLPLVRAAIKTQRPAGLLVLADLLTVAHRGQLATLAARSRVPAIFPLPDFVDAGGLMAYGPSWSDAFRGAARYVDGLLRGARPGELPVERPGRFELHLNLTAARALQLAIPSSLLLEATRVLQ